MPHKRIRTFNKYVTNRITRGFASFSHGPFALIRHIGRRSGKQYETPIMVEPMGDNFVIALTYGPEVDWYRNLLATGHGTLLWHRKAYTIKQPEAMAKETALQAFPPFFRLVLGRLGTQHFVRLTTTEY